MPVAGKQVTSNHCQVTKGTTDCGTPRQLIVQTRRWFLWANADELISFEEHVALRVGFSMADLHRRVAVTRSWVGAPAHSGCVLAVGHAEHASKFESCFPRSYERSYKPVGLLVQGARC